MVKKIDVCYYAKDVLTGEAWESDNFKDVYHAVLRELKDELKRVNLYERKHILINYGIHLEHDDNSFSLVSYRVVCAVIASGCDGRVKTYVERW